MDEANYAAFCKLKGPAKQMAIRRRASKHQKARAKKRENSQLPKKLRR